MSDQTIDSESLNIAPGLLGSPRSAYLDPLQDMMGIGETLDLRFGFRLGDLNFLINTATMCEVIKKPVVYAIPKTPVWIEGLINLRGMLVPVMDIKKRIEQSNADKKSDILLVMDEREHASAIFIDALPNVVDETKLTTTAIPDNVPNILRPHVIETFLLEQETWFDIDYDALIQNMTMDYL